MKLSPVLLAIALASTASSQSKPAPSATPIHLPSSKLLFEPVPGVPVPTNSFPGTMTTSPDGRYVAIVNNGRGVEQSGFNQSIGIYDLQTHKLADYPDARFKLLAQQTLYYGAAFSSHGDELYVSVASLSDPAALKPGNLGNGIAVYSFRDGVPTPSRFLKIPMQKVPAGHQKTEVCKKCAPGENPAYPAGLGILPGENGSPDRLVIANDLADNVIVMNVASGVIEKTFDLAIDKDVPAAFPYRVRVDARNHHAYVTLWNTDKVADLDLDSGKVAKMISLAEEHPLPRTSSAHPASMLVRGNHLIVALANRDQVVIADRETGKVEGRLSTRLPQQKFGGAYPTSLAISADEKTLYVANSGTNSVGVYDLAWTNSANGKRFSKATLRGAIPTEWYPVSVLVHGDDLLIATAKARGTGPNNDKAHPPDLKKPFRYIGGMIYGSLARVDLKDLQKSLPKLTAEVDRSNLIAAPRKSITFKSLPPKSWPIKHVLYVIKENRTYDQVFGDLGSGNGDPSLTMYGWEVSPNHHKLAQQFGVLDNFYTSGEVSGNGHVWSTAAITSDYTERSWQINYRGDERTYDFEGAVGNEIPMEQGIPDLDEPGTGFLWAAARRAKITYREYGEFIEDLWCVPAGEWEISPSNTAIRDTKCTKKTIHKGDATPDFASEAGGPSPYPWEIPVLVGAQAVKPELVGHFDPNFAAFRTEYPDQWRADAFLKEFKSFVAARKRGDVKHELPQLMIMHLPNDHTTGTKENHPTPQAAVADNDLALGRIVEAISNSPYWNDTAILVLEDDAQDGPDHVDAHRSPALVISKYSPAPRDGKPFVESGFFTTVNMIRTVEDLLHITPMNHNDALAAPMASMFDGKGNQPAYQADDRNLKNGLLYKVNPPKNKTAQLSDQLDFSGPDKADSALLNQILWQDSKGDEPMPPPRHTVIPERGSGGDPD